MNRNTTPKEAAVELYTLYIDRQQRFVSHNCDYLIRMARKAYFGGTARHAAVYRGSDLVMELDD